MEAQNGTAGTSDPVRLWLSKASPGAAMSEPAVSPNATMISRLDADHRPHLPLRRADQPEHGELACSFADCHRRSR